MEKDRKEENAAVAVIRWSARIFGVIIVTFSLFMFIGESLESHPHSEPLEPIAVIGLALMGIYDVAMLLALKWERAGLFLGVVALGSFFVMTFLGLFHGNVSGGFSPRGVLNPFLLAFWLPVLLYLLCRGLEGQMRRKKALI
jgi:hypothetical protein